MHEYIHTWHIGIYAEMRICIQTYIHTHMHIQTYSSYIQIIHTYIRVHIHTYTHTRDNQYRLHTPLSCVYVRTACSLMYARLLSRQIEHMHMYAHEIICTLILPIPTVECCWYLRVWISIQALICTQQNVGTRWGASHTYAAWAQRSSRLWFRSQVHVHASAACLHLCVCMYVESWLMCVHVCRVLTYVCACM